MGPKKFFELILGKDFTNWLRPYHILDWLIVILVHIIALSLDSNKIEPRNRYLPPNSSEIRYPYESDIVSFSTVFVITWIVPVVVLALFQLRYRSRHDFHHALLALWGSFGFTYLFTCIIKISVGRYRPYYDPEFHNDIESRLSFPSGHSSVSFSSAVFMSLYLCGKMRIFRQTSGSMVSKMMVIFVPIVAAGYVAVSRTVDYHHNFSDIIAGSLLGSGMAIPFYFMHFPSLFSEKSPFPKSHHLDHVMQRKQEKEMKVKKVETVDATVKESISSNA